MDQVFMNFLYNILKIKKIFKNIKINKSKFMSNFAYNIKK
jgi:hypothetical protein